MPGPGYQTCPFPPPHGFSSGLEPTGRSAYLLKNLPHVPLDVRRELHGQDTPSPFLRALSASPLPVQISLPWPKERLSPFLKQPDLEGGQQDNPPPLFLILHLQRLVRRGQEVPLQKAAAVLLVSALEVCPDDFPQRPFFLVGAKESQLYQTRLQRPRLTR